jgi:hypothetical protein
VITADTITDEQIRELCLAIEAEGARSEYAYCIGSPGALAQIANGRSKLRTAARARCAEILNARAKEGE